jgi:hypothetical protein
MKNQPTEKQMFVMKAAPSEWASYAGEIRETMDLLWAKQDGSLIVSYSGISGKAKKKSAISRTWFLLAGFCLENLLKGLLIAENPRFIKDGKLDNRLKTHKLTHLARMIKSFTFNENEEELFVILEKCIPSWGRYPIPLSVKEITEEISISLDEKNTFDYLYDRLDLHLYKMIRHGWQGPHDSGSDGYIRSDYEDMPDGFEKMSFEEIFEWRNKKSDDD